MNGHGRLVIKYRLTCTKNKLDSRAARSSAMGTVDGRRSISDAGAGSLEAASSRPGVLSCQQIHVQDEGTANESRMSPVCRAASPVRFSSVSSAMGTLDGRRSISDAGAAYLEAACSRPGVCPSQLEAHVAEKARAELTRATEECGEAPGAKDKADQGLEEAQKGLKRGAKTEAKQLAVQKANAEVHMAKQRTEIADEKPQEAKRKVEAADAAPAEAAPEAEKKRARRRHGHIQCLSGPMRALPSRHPLPDHVRDLAPIPDP